MYSRVERVARSLTITPRISAWTITLVLSACLTKEEKLALFDDDLDGFHTSFGADYGGVEPWDCDDENAAVNPGATEVCNGIDDDCDDAIDEEVEVTIYGDSDQDGFGVESIFDSACAASAGWSVTIGDCADDDASIYPGATDEWYDGVDSNCDGVDDFDADADGQRDYGHGGADCNDEDPTIFDGAEETWWDIGRDNDCDGSVNDQAVLDLDDVRRIDGDGDSAFLGNALLVLPAGWAADDEVLLVSSYGRDGYRGAVYGWERDDLAVSTSLGDATFSIHGPDNAPTPFGATLGISLGCAGDVATPLTAIGLSGTSFGTGMLMVWRGQTLDQCTAAVAFTIEGDRPGIAAGGPTLSGADLDDDGIDDLVTSAVIDDRVAPFAGTVAVFFDPTGLAGAVPYGDADSLLTVNRIGYRALPVRVGDVDNDGRVDLGVTNGDGGSPSGWIVTDVPIGQADVSTVAAIALPDAGGVMEAFDTDQDGTLELIAYSGGARRFDLPASGALPLSTSLPGTFGFSDPFLTMSSRPGAWISAPRTGYSPKHDNSRGMVSVATWFSTDDVVLESGRLIARGEAAGDAFGETVAFMNIDDDTVTDLIIGATRADSATHTDPGAIYLVPGAR